MTDWHNSPNNHPDKKVAYNTAAEIDNVFGIPGRRKKP